MTSMKRALAGVVVVALIVAFLSAGLAEERGSRPVPSRARLKKRVEKLEAQVRANQEALDQFVRSQRPLFSAPDGPPTRFAPAPYPFAVAPNENVFVPDARDWTAPTPFPSNALVPDPATAAFPSGPLDACLVTVDGAAIDPHFVVMARHGNPRMIVAPRVTGLPFGSLSHGR
jgi:hypothetical protein